MEEGRGEKVIGEGIGEEDGWKVERMILFWDDNVTLFIGIKNDRQMILNDVYIFSH